MILATLDTNILASGVRKLDDPVSTPGQVLSRWIEGEFDLACLSPILVELERTLNNRYFRRNLTDDQIADVLQLLRSQSSMTELSVTVVGVASHTADDLILATAASARASFLVTGDQALLDLREYDGVRIVSAREFLTILEQQQNLDG